MRNAQTGRFVVVLCSSGREDLADVVHDVHTAHCVVDGIAYAGGTDVPLSIGVVPVHCFAGAGLEDRAVAPGEEPCVVVFAVDAFVVGSQHRFNGCSREKFPRVCFGIVEFAGFAADGAAPGAADCEDVAGGEDGAGMIAARDVHVGSGDEFVGEGHVDASFFGVGAAAHDEAAVAEGADAGTEHVVLCF